MRMGLAGWRIFLPSILQNLSYWNNEYDWRSHGEEWSAAWGSSEAQWKFTILPRIIQYLPKDTVLEIGPGHGRWTRCLRHYAKHLLTVDISPKCADACRQQFRDVQSFVNDGLSLNMIIEDTLDFVFSFDSLVHADATVLESYLRQLRLKMKPSAVGFIHHSNLGAYRQRLSAYPLPSLELWRSRDVDADIFFELCVSAGLCCIKQELVNWSNVGILLDCFSTIVNCSPSQRCSRQFICNWEFMNEAILARGLPK